LRQMIVVNSPNEGPSASTRTASSERSVLTSILPRFTGKGKYIRRRYTSSMKNANRKIEELHDKNATLLRSNKRIQKRIERLRAGCHNQSACLERTHSL
jgi:predicted RNase H-like nuclease (RuvC/YqgF family)